MQSLALAMVGGALGSGLRWLVAVQLAERGWDRLPWHTLLVNVAGSLALGVIAAWSSDAARISEPMRIFVTVGVLGGFTTYSSFNEEALRMLRIGSTGKGLAYMALTVGLCLLAGALGHWLGNTGARGALR